MRHFAHKDSGKSHHRFLAHQKLFNDHGILHRDISLNNILLYRPKADDIADGLLIDFDYSEELELLDAHEDHATEECEAEINELAECEAEINELVDAETDICTDSIRTVCSHFINCPWR